MSGISVRKIICAAAMVPLVMAAGVGLASAASAQPTATPVPGGPVPASAVARLTAMADSAVKVNGDVQPRWAVAVVTTHQKALKSCTPGDWTPGNGTVYLVTMKGHFVAEEASPPMGASLPHGTYLCFDVNARSFASEDFGVSSKPSPVPPATLGPVTHLKVSVSASRQR